MNSFQILDKEGNAISIAILDKEAAEFWGRETDSRYYVAPKPKGYDEMNLFEKARHDTAGNWYDIIGWNIATQGHYTSGWPNVVYTLCAEGLGRLFLNKEDPLSIVATDVQLQVVQYLAEDFYKPYLDLIRYWSDKGYQPKQIKE